MNERDLRRVADLLGNFGIAGSVLGDVLVLRVPVTDNQTFPVLLSLEELGPDLYRAQLSQSARVAAPRDPETALALFTFANVANSNMDVARCAVLPDDDDLEDVDPEDQELEDDELEDLETEDGDGPPDDADLEEEETGEEVEGDEGEDAPGFAFVRCDVSSVTYLGGLKQNHLKLLARHVEAFTDDVTGCLARFLETAGPTPQDDETEDAGEDTAAQPDGRGE